MATPTATASKSGSVASAEMGGHTVAPHSKYAASSITAMKAPLRASPRQSSELL